MVGTSSRDGFEYTDSEQDLRDAIETVGPFIRVDRLSAAAALVLVLVAWLVGVREGNYLLYIGASIALLVAMLHMALGELERLELLNALALATGGNWIVAVIVAWGVPQLWPVMILTALLPVLLSTPFLQTRQLVFLLVTTALLLSLIAAAGLLNDDGGVVPDLEDELEVALVIGGVIALVAPTALIVRNNNLLLQQRLVSMRTLNDELRMSRRDLARSRRRVVEASDTERRRIERDLHDGAQQRLVSIGVRLRLLESTMGTDHELNPSIATLITEAEEAIEELRQLAHGIYPPLLETSGLAAALQVAARRSGLSIETDLEELERVDTNSERALYFVALEALTNAAKFAPQAAVKLSLSRADSTIHLVVQDEGPGFDQDQTGRSHGTHHMGDRIAAIGGELTIDSTPGLGTTVAARVPVDA